MSGAPRAAAWSPDWFDTGVQPDLAMAAWRGVEAQHLVATMRLVDGLDEQAVLEQLLEASKPPVPTDAQRSPAEPHFLLSTPFRYRPRHGSRFRSAGSRGIWYGAQTLHAACAEVAYWRWRFLIDSDGLAGGELLSEHSFFRAEVRGSAIDLLAPPWLSATATWRHPSDYSGTQALAAQAAERGVQWIRYGSVRDPEGAACAAVLALEALRALRPEPPQTWHCRTTSALVMMAHDAERFAWRFDAAPAVTASAANISNY